MKLLLQINKYINSSKIVIFIEMNLIERLNEKYANYNRNVNWYVFIFVVLMTMGSWIDINGLWCQMPLMVHDLPEGWSLPSIVSLCMQISQVGPWSFLALKFLFPKKVSYVLVIYIILSIGAISCFLLAFFWKTTVLIAGQQRSIGLYILSLTLGLLDGTSSVTFMPFIGTYYKKEYIIPIYVGESLSAMIPSVLGLIQGIGKDPGCRNVSISQNETQLYPIPLKPKYSVSVYYLFLFLLLTISTIGFTLLKYARVSQKALQDNKSHKDDSELQNLSIDIKKEPIELHKHNPKNEQIALLLITLIVSTLAFGILPSLQSYSTLPYGKSIYHLSTNLSYFFLPFITFFTIWSFKVSTLQIVAELCIALSCSFYIIGVATLSPCPFLLQTWYGEALIITCWIITTCLFMRIRCVITARLQDYGQKLLLIFGGISLIGQFIGGLSIYLSINKFGLFESLPPCISDTNGYCLARN